jgi:hypothetical protein
MTVEQLNRINRMSQVRLLAREIAKTYHGRPVDYEYLFGEATGGHVFVECAEAALSLLEDLNS